MAGYSFPDVPLTPHVFAEVALANAPRDRTLSRKELSDLVVAAHLDGGGKEAKGTITATAKKALQTLADAGRVRNVSHGYWRFVEPLAPDEVNEPVEIGSGPESVYVYYFPAYRDQAAHLGRETWPMKIGMSAREVAPRIRDQVGTAMPEQPVVGLIYRTDSASNHERLLHSTLRARGRHMADAPGKEWFDTSLVEIREILDFALRK